MHNIALAGDDVSLPSNKYKKVNTSVHDSNVQNKWINRPNVCMQCVYDREECRGRIE